MTIAVIPCREKIDYAVERQNALPRQSAWEGYRV